MKRIATVLCLATLIAGTAVAAPPGGGPGSGPGGAQDQQGPGQDQQRPRGPDMKALAKELGLNEDQMAKLKTILEKHRQEMQSMHQAGMQRGEAAMQQRHALRDKHREELLTVLSYEQLYKFEKFMEQNRPRGRMGSGPGMSGGPGMGGGQGMQRPSSQTE